MNPMHVHLIVNHVPVVGAWIGVGLLAYGAWTRDVRVERAALALFVLLALAAAAAFVSGGRAEDAIEKLLQVPESLIEAHEDWAERAAIAMGVLAAVSLWGLWRLRKEGPLAGGDLAAAFGASLACVLLLARTAYLGGLIRHSEMQPDWNEAPASAQAEP